MKTTAFYTYIFFLGVAIAQAISYYPIMPDVMASHFSGSGKADDWMSKESFFIFHALINLLMFGIFIIMPKSFQQFRVKNMNLPNKDYWLAPERIEGVYKYFQTSFAWFGVATMILLSGSVQLVFEANIQPNPVLNSRIFLILLGGYFVFVTVWLITFYKKFNKID